MTKEYLGDSVYVEIENGMIKLTTENGYGPSNTIFLEVVVYDHLVKYVTEAEEFYRKAAEEGGAFDE